MYNIERGRGPIIGDIINSSKFSDSQQDFLLGDEKFNFISRRIDDVSEGMVNKYFYNNRLKSNASQKAPLEFANQKQLAVIKETDLLQIILCHRQFYIFLRRVWLYFWFGKFWNQKQLNWITKFYQEMWKPMSRI